MKTIYIIGRESDCDIYLWSEASEISRYHAQLRIDQNGEFWLLDTSLHGTYVNGMRIPYNQEVKVSRKDEIVFAGIERFDWNTIPNKKKWFWVVIWVSAAILLAGGVTLCLLLLPMDSSDTQVSNLVEESAVVETHVDSLDVKVEMDVAKPIKSEVKIEDSKVEKRDESTNLEDKINEEIYSNLQKKKAKKSKKSSKQSTDNSSKASDKEQMPQTSEKKVIDAIF